MACQWVVLNLKLTGFRERLWPEHMSYCSGTVLTKSACCVYPFGGECLFGAGFVLFCCGLKPAIECVDSAAACEGLFCRLRSAISCALLGPPDRIYKVIWSWLLPMLVGTWVWPGCELKMWLGLLVRGIGHVQHQLLVVRCKEVEPLKDFKKIFSISQGEWFIWKIQAGYGVWAAGVGFRITRMRQKVLANLMERSDLASEWVEKTQQRNSSVCPESCPILCSFNTHPEARSSPSFMSLTLCKLLS